MTTEEYGSLVPAVCVNLLLYTLEFVMACVFLSRRAKEGAGAFDKFRTVLTLLLDTACTLAGCVFLYFWQDTHWGDNDEVQGRFWKLLIGTLVLGTASTAIAQSYLLQKFWTNIPNHLIGTALIVSLLVVTLLGSVASVAVCAYMQWTNAEQLVPFIWTALIASLVTAFGITSISVCQRIAVKSVAKRNFIVRGWKAFVSTGMPGSIICILALVAWVMGKHTTYIIALYFVLARVYSCTMLFTMHYPLPIRKSMIQDLVNTSVAQGTLPLTVSSPSPDIFLKSERGTQPKEGNVQSWYNIDLGDGAMRTSRSAPENINGDQQDVNRRNAAVYQKR
ncbi:unnamed protein product [Mycena citricolor]|uniref:Uncharacterized protein n=1 Tax=Mycena citricolor TaxID=2018698 RepID=A0AAD2HFV6_9AGAR|nr:unnamed protein product [Mycena citricolor]